jgi:hypothetical protein
VVIRRSSTGDVRQLLADLADSSGDDVRREAAVARLRVTGARAIRQVVAALLAARSGAERVALLRVLEGRQDPGLVDPVLRFLAAGEADVRVAAIAVARGLLDGERGGDVFDRLTALAVASDEAQPVRLAAIAVITELPARTVGPILLTLQQDDDPAIRLASVARPAGGDDPGADIEAASSGDLPADPQRLVDALARDGSTVPLPTLHRLVTTLREREQEQRRESRQREWEALRGIVHNVLARRESRVALYDLRETLEQADHPLPDDFVSAAAAIGDASCLEAIAAAFARSSHEPDQDAWRISLAAAAAAIMSREKITRRNATIRRIRSRWGDTVSALLD